MIFIPGPKDFGPEARYDVPILLLEFVGPVTPTASPTPAVPTEEGAEAAARVGGVGGVRGTHTLELRR